RLEAVGPGHVGPGRARVEAPIQILIDVAAHLLQRLRVGEQEVRAKARTLDRRALTTPALQEPRSRELVAVSPAEDGDVFDWVVHLRSKGGSAGGPLATPGTLPGPGPSGLRPAPARLVRPG